MPEIISSVQNPRVKNLVRLAQATHRKRQGRFLVEGWRENQRALEGGWPMESLFFCETLFKSENAFEVIHLAEELGTEVVQMTEGPFRKCAYRQGADGILGVAAQKTLNLSELSLADNPLLVIVEGLEKPGNLGAIMRTCNAAGCDALIITEMLSDPYNPNAIRASQGAFFDLQFFCCSNQEAKEFLSGKGINVVTTSPMSQRTIWDCDLTQPTALVFGSEDNGLSEEWLGSSEPCKLPMRGLTDSLNVSSSVAVAVFEAIRQRTNPVC